MMSSGISKSRFTTASPTFQNALEGCFPYGKKKKLPVLATTATAATVVKKKKASEGSSKGQEEKKVMSGGRDMKRKQFDTVCPNCHSMNSLEPYKTDDSFICSECAVIVENDAIIYFDRPRQQQPPPPLQLPLSNKKPAFIDLTTTTTTTSPVKKKARIIANAATATVMATTATETAKSRAKATATSTTTSIASKKKESDIQLISCGSNFNPTVMNDPRYNHFRSANGCVRFSSSSNTLGTGGHPMKRKNKKKQPKIEPEPSWPMLEVKEKTRRYLQNLYHEEDITEEMRRKWREEEEELERAKAKRAAQRALQPKPQYQLRTEFESKQWNEKISQQQQRQRKKYTLSSPLSSPISSRTWEEQLNEHGVHKVSAYEKAEAERTERSAGCEPKISL